MQFQTRPVLPKTYNFLISFKLQAKLPNHFSVSLIYNYYHFYWSNNRSLYTITFHRENYNCQIILLLFSVEKKSLYTAVALLAANSPQKIFEVFSPPPLIDRCCHIFNQKSIFKYLYTTSVGKKPHFPPNFKSIKSLLCCY